MIEILENVLKYSDRFEVFVMDHPDYQPEFELILNEDGFVLTSRNPVRDKDQKEVSRRINKINTSDDLPISSPYTRTYHQNPKAFTIAQQFYKIHLTSD